MGGKCNDLHVDNKKLSGEIVQNIASYLVGEDVDRVAKLRW